MNHFHEMLPFLVPQPDRRPPARITTALEFLRDLSFKTMDRAAISDVAIEVIPGSKLTDSEQNTRVAACSVLEDYFLGRLQPTQQEQLEQKKLEEDDSDVGGTMRCLACDPRIKPSPNCIYCKGSGFILVLPAPTED